jgi:hypothetical protein
VRETGIAGFGIPREIDLYSGTNTGRQAFTKDLRFKLELASQLKYVRLLMELREG